MRLTLLGFVLFLSSCGYREPSEPAVCEQVDEITAHFREHGMQTRPDHRIELRGFVFRDVETHRFSVDANLCDVIAVDFMFASEIGDRSYFRRSFEQELIVSTTGEHLVSEIRRLQSFEFGRLTEDEDVSRIDIIRYLFLVRRTDPAGINFDIYPIGLFARPGWRSVRVDINSADVDNSPNPN